MNSGTAIKLKCITLIIIYTLIDFTAHSKVEHTGKETKQVTTWAIANIEKIGDHFVGLMKGNERGKCLLCCVCI